MPIQLTAQNIKYILYAVGGLALAGFLYYNYATWRKSIWNEGFRAGSAAQLEQCKKDMERLQKAPWRREAPALPPKSEGKQCAWYNPFCP